MYIKILSIALFFAHTQVLAFTFTTEEYPPYNYSTDGGKTITGYATDVINEMIKRTGINANVVIYPWKRAYMMAQKNKETCVYSTTRMEVRENLFKWVGPVATDNWIVFAKADSSAQVSALDDLKRLKVATYQGDSKNIFLKSHDIATDEAINEKLNARKLGVGRVDVWVSGANSGPWIAKDVGIKIKPLLAIKEVHLYLACNLAIPDSEIAIMNDAISSIKADGTYDKLMKAYQ